MTQGPTVDWHALTRCVHCEATLRWERDQVVCSGCSAEFPIVRGVPILIDSVASVFDAHSIAASRTTRTVREGLRRFVPEISLNPGAEARYAHVNRLLGERHGPQLVLVVGAGEGGRGIESLDAAGVELLRTDVAIGPSTDVCLDAHAIPFADDSFDAVIAQAVLEHVASPTDCVREFVRVLKPGGVVYAETPFMQQVHMGAYDFTRFTPSGHRRLFGRFEEIDSGVAVGPGSALAWSVVYFLVSFATSARAERLIGVLARFSVFWLKYFDLVLNRRPAAADAAAGVYFLGALSKTSVHDREVVAGYRGGRRFR